MIIRDYAILQLFSRIPRGKDFPSSILSIHAVLIHKEYEGRLKPVERALVACSNLIVCRASSVVGSSPTQNFFFFSLLAHHDMTRKIALSLSGLLSGHYLHQELFEQIF
jgi:hypothetical protein